MCSLCGHRFTFQSNLSRHFAKVHKRCPKAKRHKAIGEVESCRILTLTVLVATIDAQWEGMGDVGSARYEPALLPPCTTIRVLSYSN